MKHLIYLLLLIPAISKAQVNPINLTPDTLKAVFLYSDHAIKDQVDGLTRWQAGYIVTWERYKNQQLPKNVFLDMAKRKLPETIEVWIFKAQLK